MEVWEIAVAIIAVTYLFVSIASMGIMIRLMSKFDGLFDKYVKFAEKELEEDEDVEEVIIEDEEFDLGEEDDEDEEEDEE